MNQLRQAIAPQFSGMEMPEKFVVVYQNEFEKKSSSFDTLDAALACINEVVDGVNSAIERNDPEEMRMYHRFVWYGDSYLVNWGEGETWSLGWLW